ncbi:hypothetical protein L7F22_047124 [Adiantum nelumboides]|nr:hypothetical protein [Adiantum nelumboides]
MADNNEESRIIVDNLDFAHEGANDDTPMLVNYLVTRFQQAMANPALQGEVQQQLHAYEILPTHQEERDPVKSLGETSKRGLSMAKEGENPYQELWNLLLEEPPSKDKERSESPYDSMEEDVAPQRHQVQRSPTPTKRKRSPSSPPHRESKREEKNSKKEKERKRSPSSPSSSPSPSSNESGRYSSKESPRGGHRRSHAAWKRSNKLKKFKEGGKSISFLTYDGEVFEVGDFLLFTYNKSTENVLEVSAADLASCTTIDPIVRYTDGNSTVLLSNYTTRFFISGIPGHCLASMTLQIHVGSPAPTPSPSPEPAASPLLPPATIVSPTPYLTPPLSQQVNSPPSPLPSSASRSWNVPCLVALLAAALGAAATV